MIVRQTMSGSYFRVASCRAWRIRGICCPFHSTSLQLLTSCRPVSSVVRGVWKFVWTVMICILKIRHVQCCRFTLGQAPRSKVRELRKSQENGLGLCRSSGEKSPELGPVQVLEHSKDRVDVDPDLETTRSCDVLAKLEFVCSLTRSFQCNT